MKTLDQLRQRCDIDPNDPDSCWGFPASKVKAPLFDGTDRQGAVEPQRAAWLLAHQRKIKRGWRVYGVCGNPECVNPDHVRSGSMADHGKFIASTGAQKGNPKRLTAARAAARKQAKLSLNQARETIGSTKPVRELAAQFGCAISTASKYRSGLARCYGAQVNPWAGLERCAA